MTNAEFAVLRIDLLHFTCHKIDTMIQQASLGADQLVIISVDMVKGHVEPARHIRVFSSAIDQRNFCFVVVEGTRQQIGDNRSSYTSTDDYYMFGHGNCLLMSELMCFPRYEACVALLWEGSHIVMFGFLNPGWNIFCGTWIAGQDSKNATNW